MITSHRLFWYVCIASSAIRESAGSYLELVSVVESKDIYAVTVHSSRVRPVLLL